MADAPCPRALARLLVTTRVMELGLLAAAGEEDAAERLDAMAALLEPR